MGGSSAINFMGWDRGSKKDYDAWKTLSDADGPFLHLSCSVLLVAANLRIGWDWDSLLPHLRGCEQLASTPDPYPSLSESKDHVVGSGDPEPHGKSGLVKVRAG